eukprot:GEMP01052654.1.p1 GENE.GEMP01052654.1~~GEMP01052654.1.p1  ORF type:complete len:335 (+),score=29.33 GEMP01052654.1:124-1128(+)
MWGRIDFAGYSCEFSPFRGDLLAVGSAQYFGIVGNGKQSVFRRSPANEWEPVVEWLTKDGVYDTTWSEDNEFVLASAQGDGTIKLFDINHPHGPICSLEEHKNEVYSVDWNLNMRHLIASASWDFSVKVWDTQKLLSVRTYRSHQAVAYASIWSPHHPATLASVAGDGRLNICDVNVPGEGPINSVVAHQYEVLAVDWSKYNEFQLITGSVDRTLRGWDLRNLSVPTHTLFGHQLAARRVKCHPHQANLVLSASYDMGVNVWDLSINQLSQRFDHHQEFVLGIDISLFDENLVASVSWDRTICAWNHEHGPPPPPPPGFFQPAPRQAASAVKPL